MYALFVHIRVLPGQAARFLEITAGNHRGSRTEPGNIRFDVLRDNADPDRFYFYEVYRDEAAFKAHQQTPHYFAWKAAADPLMAEPRRAEKMAVCMPEPWA